MLCQINNKTINITSSNTTKGQWLFNRVTWTTTKTTTNTLTNSKDYTTSSIALISLSITQYLKKIETIKCQCNYLIEYMIIIIILTRNLDTQTSIMITLTINLHKDRFQAEIHKSLDCFHQINSLCNMVYSN